MKIWTKEEKEFIEQNYGKISNKEMAKILNRTKQSIVNYAYYNGLKFSEEAKSEIYRKNLERYREQNKGLKGKNNPNWKGGISKNNYHYKKLQVERYPEKIRARRLTQYAIKTGKLKRQPCEVCGETPTFAHHDDYDKPLEVRWFCREHHREQHGGKH